MNSACFSALTSASAFKAFKSYKEMISDPEIDAIDICAPTFAHRELATLALNAGKHVICEKPLAPVHHMVRRPPAALSTRSLPQHAAPQTRFLLRVGRRPTC